MHLDLQHLQELIKSLGFWGGHFLIWIIIFAESGLLIGFFLPGDSLLFTTGVLASPAFNILDIRLLILGSFICAVLGDSVGYATGYRLGRKLFQRQDSWLFHKKNLVKAQNFYEKYGANTVVIARFMPIVRTFAPIVAGIGAMNYRTFIVYNVVGGFGWTFGVTLLGYFLGKAIPPEQVDKYLLPIVLLIIFISLAPSIIHLIQEKRSKKR